LFCYLFPPTYNFAQEDFDENSFLDSLYDVSVDKWRGYEYKKSIKTARLLLEEALTYNKHYYTHYGHNILGLNYADLNDTVRAKNHYQKGFIFAKKSEDDALLLSAYNNLGNVYSDNKNTIQKGIDYYNLVIDLATELNQEEKLFNPTVNIAWTYLDKEEYEKAWPYLERSWTLFGDGENTAIKSQLNSLTGRHYVGIQDLDKAKPYFEEAIMMVERDSLIFQASEIYDEYGQDGL